MEKKEIYKLRIKLKNSREWFTASYHNIGGVFKVFVGRKLFRGISGPPDLKTTRKTAYTNFCKWKTRRKILNSKLKEGKNKNNLNMFTDFLWAKYWRKSEALKIICADLLKEPDLPAYTISNKDRVAQILNAVEQADEHYKQFSQLFIHVPKDFGYGIQFFDDFKKELRAEELALNRRMPREYHSYFNASSPY